MRSISLALVLSAFAFASTDAHAMNKKEMAEKLVVETMLPLEVTTVAVDRFTNSITGSLKKGDRVALVGFGSFSVSAFQTPGGERYREVEWTFLGDDVREDDGCGVTVTTMDLAASIAAPPPTKGEPVITIDEALVIISAFQDLAIDALEANEPIELGEFGTFYAAREVPLGPVERTGRSPQTGEAIEISAKNVVRFKAGSELSSKVN